MRRAARTDANHTEVVSALRGIGASVVSLSAVGAGVPDIMCGHNGINWLLEVKDGEKSPSRRRLTDDEQAFMIAWKGQYAVVNSAEEAIAVVTA